MEILVHQFKHERRWGRHRSKMYTKFFLHKNRMYKKREMSLKSELATCESESEIKKKQYICGHVWKFTLQCGLCRLGSVFLLLR